jgi:hypothetical protein
MLRITIDTSGLDGLTEQLKQAATKAETAVAVQAAKDTRPYVPMLTGSLDARTQVVGNQIIYPGPYARFLYYGKLMVDPETGSPWARKGVSKVATDQNLVFTTDFHPQAQSHWFEASKAENLNKWLRVAGEAVSLDG